MLQQLSHGSKAVPANVLWAIKFSYGRPSNFTLPSNLKNFNQLTRNFAWLTALAMFKTLPEVLQNKSRIASSHAWNIMFTQLLKFLFHVSHTYSQTEFDIGKNIYMKAQTMGFYASKCSLGSQWQEYYLGVKPLTARILPPEEKKSS